MKYFRGGWLASTHFESKSQALRAMEEHIDGHCVEKESGLFKGKTIYKYPKESK